MSPPQGKDAVPFLEGLVVGDIAGLADGTGSLSVFTNEKGGIIDDTVITKVGGSGWDLGGEGGGVRAVKGWAAA
jgi:glycine cleavage system aminomethyltransferase T